MVALCCCNSGTTSHIHPSIRRLFDSTLQHVNIGLTPPKRQTQPLSFQGSSKNLSFVARASLRWFARFIGLQMLQWWLWLSMFHLLSSAVLFHHWHHHLLSVLVRVYLLLRLLLFSISYIRCGVLIFSNGLLDTHDRNIAPCGIICRDAMGAMVF